MLDYNAFTKNEKALEETILPVVTEVMTIFDQHWGRDDNGKILFDPAMALETYQIAINPLPDIVGIQKVCTELLKLPETAISDEQLKQYKRLITELPEIPMREVNGEKLLAPAHEYRGKQNIENPELYAIFTYRRFSVGKDNLELAIRTFNSRESRENRGWDLKMKNNIVIEPISHTFTVSAHYYTWFSGGGPSMFGENGLLRKRLTENVNVYQSPYSEKYPELLNYLHPIIEGQEWEGMIAHICLI